MILPSSGPEMSPVIVIPVKKIIGLTIILAFTLVLAGLWALLFYGSMPISSIVIDLVAEQLFPGQSTGIYDENSFYLFYMQVSPAVQILVSLLLVTVSNFILGLVITRVRAKAGPLRIISLSSVLGSSTPLILVIAVEQFEVVWKQTGQDPALLLPSLFLSIITWIVPTFGILLFTNGASFLAGLVGELIITQGPRKSVSKSFRFLIAVVRYNRVVLGSVTGISITLSLFALLVIVLLINPIDLLVFLFLLITIPFIGGLSSTFMSVFRRPNTVKGSSISGSLAGFLSGYVVAAGMSTVMFSYLLQVKATAITVLINATTWNQDVIDAYQDVTFSTFQLFLVLVLGFGLTLLWILCGFLGGLVAFVSTLLYRASVTVIGGYIGRGK